MSDDEREALLSRDQEKESRNDDQSNPVLFIDIFMIPSKICFFLIDGLFGMFWAYLVLFFTSIGLDIKEAGFISGMRLLTATIATPIWGYISDYTGRRKIVFTILCLGAAVTVFPLPFVAKENPIQNCNVSSVQNDTSVQHLCHNKLFTSKLFFIMLSLICVCSIFSNPLHGIIDSFVMNAIQSSPRETDYGKQRLVGAVGFGASNFLVGLAIDHVGKFTTSIYSPVFYMVVFLLVLLIPAGITVASQSKWEEKKGVSEPTESKWKLVTTFFCSLDNNVFVISACIAGISNTVVNVFLFQLMNDELHAPKTVMGLSNAFAGLGEVLVLPFAETIIKLFKGPINAITFALFSYVVRFTLIGIVKNAWLILPIQLLNGFGYGLFWAAAAGHTETIAPKGIYITTFSIVSNSYFNVGGMCGNWIGGLIYGNYSGVSLFLGSACLCSVCVLLFLLYFNIFPRLCSKTEVK